MKKIYTAPCMRVHKIELAATILSVSGNISTEELLDDGEDFGVRKQEPWNMEW